MPALLFVFTTALLMCITPSARATALPAHDLAGSRDNPIVSRFAGSVIVGYQTSDYDQMAMPMGRSDASGQKSARIASAEGRITRIAYVVPNGASALEVWRNYQQALSHAGFQTRFSCHGDGGPQGCGSAFALARNISNPLLAKLNKVSATQNLMISTLWPANGNAYVETAHLTRPDGTVDVSLLVSQGDNQPTGVLLQIAEGKAMATGEVTVDAKAMSQGLAQNGHIALYGIHFASDSAALSADSDATLAQMAALLKNQPSLKVYIVGHTDDTGAVAHNLQLSQQRAEAVVKALAARGIATSRMAAKGLASYAPVASNHSDSGKAQNRRVELVEQ
ncbi:DUF4892 domain-containing protein [Dyella sp.]|uniref:DUF4892 domain-containing protein n=1 Tax=Dyella sp. TaxID=1869338 RepID=UPI002ED5DDC4